MAIDNPVYYQILGSKDIIQLPDKRTWNLTDGLQVYKRFGGTADAVKAKFNALASAELPSVDEINEEINGQSGTLICRIWDYSGAQAGGNTEANNAVWELRGQDVMKPIETHSDFDTIIASRKRAIENYVRDPAQYSTTLANDAEKKLAGYLAHQVLEFPLTEYILRKSIILSRRSTIQASYTNCNRVVAMENIAPPSVLLGVLTNLPKMDGTSGAWEWLKKTPQCLQVSKQKFQLYYEWWGVERWAEIYGGSWNPSYT